MLRVLGIVVVLLGLVIAGAAQAPQPADQSDTVKALLEEVHELKARLAAVEAKQAQSGSAPAEAVAAPVQQVPVDTGALGVVRGIKMQGFGMVGWRANDNHAGQPTTFGFSEGPGGKFAIGDFDLFLTSRINDKSMVLSELVIRDGDAQSFSVELARMLLKYDFNEYLKISAGRYHTSTSYYNQNFHSGAWLQTPAERPLAVQFSFEGGLLPSQAIGVSVTGKVPSGKLGLNYIFEYGSSDTTRLRVNSRETTITDESNSNGLTGGLFAKPDWLPGLEFGGSIYHDRLNPTDSGLHMGQTIISGHAVYVTPKFEFLNEAFLIRHVLEGGRAFNTPAAYTLMSYNFTGKWRPYFMYEYANANATPLILDDVGLRHGPTAGVRYDFNGFTAFKAQYVRTYRRAPLSVINGVETQLAFRF